jgi:hypothetical protein
MDSSVKIRLPTTITIVGYHHHQIVHIQLNPHNRSILGRAYASLFQNHLTQNMNSTISIPKVHKNKGLTGRMTKKMAWALALLHDPDTLRTYEDYAKEAAYKIEDTQPSTSNPQTRRNQAQNTPPTRLRRTAPNNLSHEGTSTGTTSMDVDKDPSERTTPPWHSLR